jgi:predicted RND superfamily exporter protein
VLEVLEDAEFDGFDLTVTGSPVYLKEINDYLQGGMLTLGIAAIAVMAIVLGAAVHRALAAPAARGGDLRHPVGFSLMG